MRRNFILSGLFLLFISWVGAIDTISLHSVQQTILAEKNGEVVYSQSSGEGLSYSGRDNTASWYGSTSFANYGDRVEINTSADIYPDPGTDWNGQEYWVSSTISALIEPVGPQCEIHTSLHDEWWGCRSYAEITNQTSGEQLFYADFFGGDRDGIYPLTAGDMYQVTLYSGVSLGEENWDYLFSFGSLNLAVMPGGVIPAPASVLLALSGVATLLLAKRRKP